MTELAALDVDAVWLAGSTWRGQQSVAHLDTDCPHLEDTDVRGPLAPMQLREDMHVCKRCVPTAPESFGGIDSRDEWTLAQRLRWGDD
jgi:hypothetical protein